MKRLIVLIIVCFGSTHLYSQEFKIIEDDKKCEDIINNRYVEPVDSFKNELKVTISISEFSVGKEEIKVDKTWTVSITDETPIIKVTKNGALRISTGKVIDNRMKYYIYKIHLYKKENGCWEEGSSTMDWNRLKLGKIMQDYGFGIPGRNNHIGFKGEVIIE
ncbi:MAG: hypothetical protein PSN34_00960 [Urechidicola sp.]|nr:hypothetical protein [Urechidicola sp.]